MQEDGGHLLVLVLDEAEHFESKPAHLALPILKDRRLGVFLAASHREREVKSSLRIKKGVKKKLASIRSSTYYRRAVGSELPEEKIIAKVIVGVSRGCGVAVVH